MYDFDGDRNDPILKKAKRNRKIKRNLAGGAVLLAIFLVMMGALVFFTDSFGSEVISKDSGVSACEKMAENVGKKNVKGGDKTWGEPEYQAAMLPFENSQHADIKVAGTNMVTTIYNLEKQSNNVENLGGALVTLSTIQTQWGQLQTACANHGVTVPPLPTAA